MIPAQGDVIRSSAARLGRFGDLIAVGLRQTSVGIERDLFAIGDGVIRALAGERIAIGKCGKIIGGERIHRSVGLNVSAARAFSE